MNHFQEQQYAPQPKPLLPMAGIFIVDDRPALRELVNLSLRPSEEQEWLGERLSEVRRAVVCDCRLKEWPDALRLPEAAHLNVSFNQLTRVNFITTFSKLVHVDISHNQISHLDALASLTQVETLKFQNNRVESLRPLLQLCRLQELNAEYNRLPWNEFHIISQFKQLKILNTSHNESCDSQDLFPSFVFLNSPSLVFFNGNVVEAADIDDQRATFIKEAFDKAVLESSQPRMMRSFSEIERSPPEKISRREMRRSSTVEAVHRQRGSRSLVSARLAEAVSSGHIRSPAISTNEFSQTIRYGRGELAPVAVGISADGCGFVRWSSKSLQRAIESDSSRVVANYRNGNVAVDLVEGAGRVFDELGRVVLRLDPHAAHVIDKLTNDTLQTFVCGDHADEGFSYNHSDLSVCFDPKSWVMEVVVQTDVAEVSFSSKCGLQVRRKMEHRKKRKQKYTLASSATELENVRLGAQCVISDLAELDTLLKNLSFGGERSKS